MTQSIAVRSPATAAQPLAGAVPEETSSAAERRESLIVNGLLAVLGIMFLAPLLWIFFASVDVNASWALSWPHFTLAHFREVTRGDFLVSLVNTLLLSLVASAVSTIAAILGGYALSRRRVPLADGLMVTILFLTGIPLAIMIVPVFQVYAQFNLLNLWATGVFLGVCSLPFALWLIKTGMDAVPKELEEAARMEQASVLQIILYVTVPVALPSIFAALIYSFINAWGAFLPPLVLISDQSQITGPIKIYGLIGNSDVRYGDIAAFSLIYSLPVVILYILMSRPFSGGFSMGGAVKG
ncbi:MAG TPA: carbohydrate ABC transporter permease [Acetobacteraceae bacterium]|jgi:multiple sugar transport system permease protein|nr:carbohydrate ABC transporter permease [Acetobacteraceae bacterium]